MVPRTDKKTRNRKIKDSERKKARVFMCNKIPTIFVSIKYTPIIEKEIHCVRRKSNIRSQGKTGLDCSECNTRYSRKGENDLPLT
jgi:hypothetical protein